MGDNRSKKFDNTIYTNTHLRMGYILADNTVLNLNEQIGADAVEQNFHLSLIDDDGVDNGYHDFESEAVFGISDSVTDPAKINNMENLTQPIVIFGGKIALDTGLMGSSAGGAGTSYDAQAAQTQINITSNYQNITEPWPLGLTTVQSAGYINWVRRADLVAGAQILATIAGDANKVVIAVLPTGVTNFFGNPSAGTRIFFGIAEMAKFTANGALLLSELIEYILHIARFAPISIIAREVLLLTRLGKQLVYPSLANGVLVQSAIGIWAYGNYATIIPAVTVRVPYNVLGVNVENVSDNTELYQIECSRLSDNYILSTTKMIAANTSMTLNLGVQTPVIAADEGVQCRIAKSANPALVKTMVISLNYKLLV